MKFISDLDTTTNGKFSVEWEWAGGGRYWETFNTKEERSEALRKNQEYLDSHKEEVDEYLCQEEINYLEMLIDMNDEAYLTDYDKSKLKWYVDKKTEGHTFTNKDFENFRKSFQTT